jgi:hypothetical protein
LSELWWASDSLSVLDCLSSGKSNRSGLLLEVIRLLCRIERLGVVVRFCCVPAHSGLEDNSIVDQLKQDIIDTNVPLVRGEAKCKIRAILIDVWQK